MQTSTKSHWLGGSALKALAELGGTRWPSWALVFLVLLLVDVVTTQINEALRPILAGWWVLAPTGALVVLLGLLLRLAHTAARDLAPRATVDPRPRSVKVLILFLSPPGDLGAYSKIAGTLDDPDLEAKLGRLQWRMPITAIRHHLDRLQRVIVLASPGEHGTHRHLGAFEALVARLMPPRRRVAIKTSGAFLKIENYGGIDFEDPHALIDELGAVYKKLRDLGLAESDILIDVTGGTKVNTAAAVALASLVPHRAFQYVSTNDYRVRSFDVTWDMDAVTDARH